MSNGVKSNSSRFTITKPFNKTHDARKEEDIKLELLQNPNTESLSLDVVDNNCMFGSKNYIIFNTFIYYLDIC